MAKSKMQEDIIKQNILNNKEDNRKRKSQMEGKEVFRGNKKFKSNVPQICPTGGKTSHILVFSEDLFFIYLLPPIIFNVRQLKAKIAKLRTQLLEPSKVFEIEYGYCAEYHLGQLKAKIAKLRTQLLEPPKEGSRYVVVDIVLCSDSSLCLYFEQREQH
ncbi:hypothetical protein JHK82_055262 [Glycine max]|nr:hypothetical protein JHK86_055098 [Glycine max]KAG5073889.1 hypothetical protein JHK84_055120 [Glycine max]KAG5076567.1 hypothetical protein JHK82_055262 [Glycine max]